MAPKSLGLVACTLVLLSSAPASAGVPFSTGDLASVLARAKAENRPLMVDIATGWCAACKELDSRVFGTREAEAGLAKFIAVRVDAESGEGPAFVEKHNVVGYPTVLFLDSDGKELDRIFGTMPAAEFVATARGFLTGRGTLPEAEQRFVNERAADLELASELLFRNATRGRQDKALAYLDLIDAARGALGAAGTSPLRTASAARLAELAAQGRYVLGKYLYLRGQKNYARARDMFVELRRDFPNSEFARSALYDLAWAWHGLGETAKVRESLDAYLAATDNAVGAVSAVAWFSLRHDFQPERAIALAQAALGREPKNDELWDTLSGLYALRGDKKRALEANSRALEIKPEDPYYRQQRARLER